MSGKNLLLIVDDNQDFQDLYGMVADLAGFNVEHILDGNDALKRLEREPIPSLVLLDSRLPGLGGTEVLRAARLNEKWEHVPIYMITADLRGAQNLKTLPSENPRVDGFIEKGASSIQRLRELFEKYRE
jgi:CheY-like chemotaxis protein